MGRRILQYFKVWLGLHPILFNSFNCAGKQRSQIRWVPLKITEMYAAQVASQQGQYGLGTHSLDVNRAATYLPITNPSLEDRTCINNIHSQQANKMWRYACVCVWEREVGGNASETVRLRYFRVVLVDMCQTQLNCPPASHCWFILIGTLILSVCHLSPLPL